MVEYWSVGFKSNDPFINFPVKRNHTNKPLPHFLKNPLFHHSNIPIVSEAN